MRDLVVREALVEMSRDAAKRFRELVGAGEEIPYDVHESGDGSPLPQYMPLTERFVREHAPLLRELDSFGSACAAIESAGLAAPYLEDNGIEVPPDARRRAELAGVVFLARMWMDSTDFSLDEERLRASIAELEANADADAGEVEVVVPLRGFRMESTRLELATATIVRADTVAGPAEARSPVASGGAGWEPTFVAVARVHAVEVGGEAGEDAADQPNAGTRSVEAFRSLITALRLFKAGGVALGPHAWTRVGSGRWRRISTGAGRPRPGGYRVAEGKLGELAAFSRAVAARTGVVGAAGHPRAPSGLERAISRFEAGLERTAALDALNDCLLSLRFLLEGGGPADLGLSMRVASLCAVPDERSEVKAVIDRAIALERELWSGEPPAATADGGSPAETALAVEELSRAILKDAACGHLGADLRATADEILLADGLAVGDGAGPQRGGTAEWSAGVEGEAIEEFEEEPEPAEPVAFEAVELMPAEAEVPDGPRYGRDAPVVPAEVWLDDGEPATGTEPELQVIRRPRRITLEPSAEEETMIASAHDETQTPRVTDEASPVVRLLKIHSEEREATATRVANLFPAPETTEWSVREIAYDRTRRAEAGNQAS